MKTLTLKRFRITYGNDAKKKVVTRKASNARTAIQGLCEQYGWSCNLKQFDNTDGKDWAYCVIDQNGGTDYDMTAYAELITE